MNAIPPLVVDESGDINVYESVAALCADLEAYDVNNGCYVAFDSEGRRLELVTRGYDVIDVRVDDDQPDVPELETMLRSFIARLGPDRTGVEDPRALSVAEALEVIAEHQNRPPDVRPLFLGLGRWLGRSTTK